MEDDEWVANELFRRDERRGRRHRGEAPPLSRPRPEMPRRPDVEALGEICEAAEFDLRLWRTLDPLLVFTVSRDGETLAVSTGLPADLLDVAARQIMQKLT